MAKYGMKSAWGTLITFFILLFSYTPLAIGIDAMVADPVTTNAVWMFMDSFFGLFWTILIVFWIMIALYFLIGDL